MVKDFSIDNFHHFDGVRINHADYVPNPGDIVNVLTDMTGIDINGHQYIVKASGFWNKNVAQITGYGNDMVTINDGSANSPIVIVHPPSDAFETANFINAIAFKPYSVATHVATNVATGVETAAEGVGTAVNKLGSLANGIGNNINWIVLAAVIVGIFLLYKSFKTSFS